MRGHRPQVTLQRVQLVAIVEEINRRSLVEQRGREPLRKRGCQLLGYDDLALVEYERHQVRVLLRRRSTRLDLALVQRLGAGELATTGEDVREVVGGRILRRVECKQRFVRPARTPAIAARAEVKIRTLGEQPFAFREAIAVAVCVLERTVDADARQPAV